MISAKNLQFSYNSKTIFSFPDLYSTAEEPLLIRGKSGSGKTTLLHLLAGLLRPVKGGIWVDETNLKKLSGRRLDSFRGKHIGIIYQRPHFMFALNVLDNIMLAQYFSGIKLIPERAKEIASVLSIDHLLRKFPAQLSQGEQQRVTIARGLLNRPKVLLADEPTSSLWMMITVKT